MWNVILRWLSDNYPTLAIIVVIILITWGIASLFFKYKHRIEDTEKKVSDLPCESHRQSIQEHSSMRPTLDSINEQVTQISRWIMHMDDKMIDALSQKCSPRMMTALGRDLFDISGAKTAIEENIGFLIGEVKKKSPATPYDVESCALDVLLGNIAHPLFNEVKNYIYYQPEEVELTDSDGTKKKVKISLLSIIKLMSLELRDRYLAVQPDIQNEPDSPEQSSIEQPVTQ